MWQRDGVEAERVSGAEVGRRLGVSREAVRKWAKAPKREFPSPLGRVGRSVVWDWRSVEVWARQHGYPVRGAA
jgi:predicted DNA-binding transcriptional regulator AlpA